MDKTPEAMQRAALGAAALYIRDEAQCHVHEHATLFLMTHDGPVETHGPLCELIEDETCPHRARRMYTLKLIYQALGTESLMEFV